MRYQGRIQKPVDIIKQPWLDCTRTISKCLFNKLRVSATVRHYPDTVNKILLVRRNRLGDAVNVLPVIQGIKLCRPQIEIHVLANQYNAVIFQHSPDVDHVHVIDEKWLLGKFSLCVHPVLVKLRQESFDLVIGLGGYSSVLARLVFWVKGKYNVGMLSKPGAMYDLAYDRGVTELDLPGKHHVDDMAHLARNAGLALPDPLPVTQMLGNAGKQAQWLALCPDVKRKDSRYSVENYAQLITELLSKQEVSKVVLFTENAQSDYRRLEKYGAEWRPTRNVEEFIQEVSKCQWAITAEGGSAHVAGALGLGVIVISGMGHQAYWRPYARLVGILEKKNAVNDIPVGDVISKFRDIKMQMQMQMQMQG